MIVAFDLAGSTGVCFKDRTGFKTYTWTLTRGKAPAGRRSPLPMVRLWRRLHHLSAEFSITKVVFEETFARGNAKYRLDSLQHAVVLWAVNHGFTWQRVSPPEWKKAMLGRGSVDKVEYFLKARKAEPEHMFKTDDEAAAYWLMRYATKN